MCILDVVAGVVPMLREARATQAVKVAAIKVSQMPASHLLLTLLLPCHCFPEQQVDTAPKLPQLLSSLNAFTNMYDLDLGMKQHVDESCY